MIFPAIHTMGKENLCIFFCFSFFCGFLPVFPHFSVTFFSLIFRFLRSFSTFFRLYFYHDF